MQSSLFFDVRYLVFLPSQHPVPPLLEVTQCAVTVNSIPWPASFVTDSPIFLEYDMVVFFLPAQARSPIPSLVEKHV